MNKPIELEAITTLLERQSSYIKEYQLQCNIYTWSLRLTLNNKSLHLLRAWVDYSQKDEPIIGFTHEWYQGSFHKYICSPTDFPQLIIDLISWK